MTLTGDMPEEGNKAPDFTVVSQDMKEISLADLKNKIKVFTSFISLDTPVCDLQVKEFNRRAAKLSSNVVVVGISKDLPFAQKRFCETNKIKNVKVFSDYKFSSFGLNYGLLVNELNLLARSIIIADKNNTVRYVQLVEELTQAPDYEEALSKLDDIIKKSTPSVKLF